MSERERVIQVLENLPEDITMKDIFKTLALMFDINDRIDNFNEDEAISTDELLKEIDEWF